MKVVKCVIYYYYRSQYTIVSEQKISWINPPPQKKDAFKVYSLSLVGGLLIFAMYLIHVLFNCWR